MKYDGLKTGTTNKPVFVFIDLLNLCINNPR